MEEVQGPPEQEARCWVWVWASGAVRVTSSAAHTSTVLVEAAPSRGPGRDRGPTRVKDQRTRMVPLIKGL